MAHLKTAALYIVTKGKSKNVNVWGEEKNPAARKEIGMKMIIVLQSGIKKPLTLWPKDLAGSLTGCILLHNG